MEERAVIARELHDSLAQALSAQKLQLARLKRLMQKESGQAQLDDSVQQIDRGLNSAYRQLRELLTTFRIRSTNRGSSRHCRPPSRSSAPTPGCTSRATSSWTTAH